MFPVSQNNNMAQAYDRSITVFSPEGHLYQVDYASKIIEKGSPAVAITYKDGIIIVADKKIFSSLIIPESVEKVFKIDQHVWIACSGLIGDGRRLVDFARQIAQENKTYYDDPIEIETLVKKVASIVQYYTQYGGARPFGVSIITAGIDTLGKHIYETEPSGATTAYKAVAIGQNRPKLLAHLEKNYKPNMSFDDALKLAIKTITLNLEPKQKLEADNIEVINITEDERKAIVPQDKYSKLI
ncbi:MAG: archaeal proteasome endopeptidase complex subunit alpha [archaeon]